MVQQSFSVPDQYRQAVAQQQIEFIYRTITTQVVANPVAGMFLVWLLSDIYPLSSLLAWLSGLIGVMALRLVLWRRYWRSGSSQRDSAPWGFLFAFSNVLNGLFWGGLVFFFFTTDHMAESMVLLFAVAGFTAGSFSSHSAYLPAYISFSATAVGLVVLRLMAENGRPYEVLVGLCVVYFLALVSYARTAQNQVKAAIVMRLRVEEMNEELNVQKVALNAAKEAAEKANLAKSKFLASASHDLRQPLHALRLFADVLGAKSTDAALRPLINNINSSIGTLVGLFTNIFELARAEANVVKPECSNVELRELFGRIGIENEPVATAKNLSIRVRRTDALALTDPFLLERIVRNLVSNAIRYTYQGGVLLACRQRGQYVRIEVWDTGIGIKPEYREQIFDEFFQVDNPERDRTKGLGLGLAIVKKLAQAIGAKVAVRTRFGRGSCFSVLVPSGSSLVVEAQEDADVPAQPGSISGLRVVFVDDDPEIRQATQIMMNDWGCKVIVGDGLASVMSCLDAVDAVPDIIVTDYRLQGTLTGAEVIRVVRERYSSAIPAIILTGDTFVDTLPEAIATGARVLHKPLKPARMRILMEQLAGVGKVSP